MYRSAAPEEVVVLPPSPIATFELVRETHWLRALGFACVLAGAAVFAFGVLTQDLEMFAFVAAFLVSSGVYAVWGSRRGLRIRSVAVTRGTDIVYETVLERLSAVGSPSAVRFASRRVPRLSVTRHERRISRKNGPNATLDFPVVSLVFGPAQLKLDHLPYPYSKRPISKDRIQGEFKQGVLDALARFTSEREALVKVLRESDANAEPEEAAYDLKPASTNDEMFWTKDEDVARTLGFVVVLVLSLIVGMFFTIRPDLPPLLQACGRFFWVVTMFVGIPVTVLIGSSTRIVMLIRSVELGRELVSVSEDAVFGFGREKRLPIAQSHLVKSNDEDAESPYRVKTAGRIVFATSDEDEAKRFLALLHATHARG
jgi:hypothetical protein